MFYQGNISALVKSCACNPCDDDGERAGHKARVEDSRHADLDGLGICLGKAESNGDEVAGTLHVDRKDCGKREVRRDVSESDLNADEDADNLCDDRAGPKEWGEEREGADQREDDEPHRGCGKRRDEMRNEVAEARAENDADQHGDERHERQDGCDECIDGLAPRLIERSDDAAHHLSDLRHEAAGLLGDLLRGIVFRLRLFRLDCCGCRRGCRRTVAERDVLRLDARDVDIFLDILCEWTGGSRLLDVHGEDALLRIDAAAQRTAAVDNRREDLILGDAGLEAVHDLRSGHFTEAHRNIRDDAARDVDDLILLLVRRECERAAKAARARRYDNTLVFAHDRFSFPRSLALEHCRLFAELYALLTLYVCRRKVREPAAQEVDDESDQQIAQCKIGVRQTERGDAVRNAEEDEHLAGVDVREHAVHRVASGRGCRVVGGLVVLGQEFSERERHRVAEEEHADEREDDIARNGVARAEVGKFLNALVADKEHDRVHRNEQADERRDDARDPSDQGLTALVEHADEAFGKEDKRIHIGLLSMETTLMHDWQGFPPAPDR